MNTEDKIKAIADDIKSEMAKVLIGKDQLAEYLLIALFAKGHVLIEDVPGIGKTTAVFGLSRAMGLSFKRIQFTPDLMPSDVTGFNLYDPKRGEFVFQSGAVMSQIVLADEINRTSPRTQSSLLEAMAEDQVTVDGVSYPMEQPFMVLATQNPMEHTGTFPLPEAQLDRFMLKISVGYPTRQEELSVLDIQPRVALDKIQRNVIEPEQVLQIQQRVREVYATMELKGYIVDIVRQTRVKDEIELGASPRAAQMLYRAAQARALIHGRSFIVPDDVQFLAKAVLAHRMTVSFEGKMAQKNAGDMIDKILQDLAVPK